MMFGPAYASRDPSWSKKIEERQREIDRRSFRSGFPWPSPVRGKTRPDKDLHIRYEPRRLRNA